NYPTSVDGSGTPTPGPDPAQYDRVLGEYYYYESSHPGTVLGNESMRAYSTPTYFNGEVYVGLSNGPEIGLSVASLQAPSSPPGWAVLTIPNFVSTNNFGGNGSTAIVSANGSANGVVWNIDESQTSSDYLVAYSTSGTGTPIFQTPSNGSASLTAGVSGA